MMRAALTFIVVILAFVETRLTAADFEFFESRIRPLFIEHCYPCHSVEAGKSKGGLLLDTQTGWQKGGESGPALVAGDVEASLLIKAVRYHDKDLRMPPEDKALSAAQVADLETWIKSGAADPRTNQANVAVAKAETYDFGSARTNWAYRLPARPPIPEVKNQTWPKGDIDRFILAKIEEHGLNPAPAADKRTLIRRATFDLIGLPPTPREVADFLLDNSPEAFSRVIERLLASPHYGERWGRHWLDVVRYTDSVDARVVGGQEDVAEIWRYRDWVVNAFNRDLPYDQFITYQIAGDLLPPPTSDGIDTNAIIATGMYAVGAWGNGDADKEKVLTDIADDAVDVTGRAFLGLTLSCARCHDHKFDPIPTIDYYSLAGIFLSTHIIPKVAAKGSGESLLRIPLASKADLEQREKDNARIAELEQTSQRLADSELGAMAARALPHTARYLEGVFELARDTNQTIASLANSFGLESAVLARWSSLLHGDLALFQNRVKDLGGQPGLLAWKNTKGDDTPSVLYNTSAMDYPRIPARKFAMHPAPTTAVAVGWKSPISGTVQMSARIVDSDPNCGDGINWSVTVSGNELAAGHVGSGGETNLAMRLPAFAAVHVTIGQMIQLVIAPREGHACDTTLVDWQITETSGGLRSWNLTNDVAESFMVQNPLPDRLGHAAVWHFINLADQAVGPLTTNALLARMRELHKAPGLPENRATFTNTANAFQNEITNSPALANELRAPGGTFWLPLRKEESSFAAETREQLARAREEIASLKTKLAMPIPQANGLAEGGVPETVHAGTHDTRVHVRGRYDRLGETAPRRFPRLLAGDDQKPITEGSGRIQLARWIASADNPLTARVMVNRIWQHHFGEGIVRTPNNFGKLGEPPTHPELLDHLALEFIRSGWSIKAMHRAMMTSATYQQSTRGNGDPENKWFSRANRRRLESEALRDSLLVAGGQLDLTQGGPAIRDLNTLRRTLYVMTIRSDRATYQFLFDAADPSAIVDRRLDSTVSPQALFLMNHPFALAQTKALTARLARQSLASDEENIRWLYENLYARTPLPEELQIGHALVNRARATAGEQPTGGAWESYCQVLLCANEFIYVD